MNDAVTAWAYVRQLTRHSLAFYLQVLLSIPSMRKRKEKKNKAAESLVPQKEGNGQLRSHFFFWQKLGCVVLSTDAFYNAR